MGGEGLLVLVVMNADADVDVCSGEQRMEEGKEAEEEEEEEPEEELVVVAQLWACDGCTVRVAAALNAVFFGDRRQ